MCYPPTVVPRYQRIESSLYGYVAPRHEVMYAHAPVCAPLLPPTVEDVGHGLAGMAVGLRFQLVPTHTGPDHLRLELAFFQNNGGRQDLMALPTRSTAA